MAKPEHEVVKDQSGDSSTERRSEAVSQDASRTALTQTSDTEARVVLAQENQRIQATAGDGLPGIVFDATPGNPENPVATAPTDAQTKSLVEGLRTSLGLRTPEELEILRNPLFQAQMGMFGAFPTEYAPMDMRKFSDLVRNKSDAERSAADDAVRAQFGKGVEDVLRERLSGNELTEALALWNRQDGNIGAQKADAISAGLQELNNFFQGRSKDMIEKEMRALLAGASFEQIQQAKAQFVNTHRDADGNPVTLESAIANDRNLSEPTKAALKILMSGADRRTDSETLQLAQIGLENRRLEIFGEAMALASPAVREQFMKDGGAKQIEEAFYGTRGPRGGRILPPGVGQNDYLNALDYANFGKLSAITEIRANSGLWNDNKALDSAVKGMSDRERQLYIAGKSLAEDPNSNVENLSDTEKRQASQYYTDLRKQMERTGRLPELESLVYSPEGSLIAQLGEKHRGWLANSGTEEIKKDISAITPKQLEYFQQHPERIADLEKFFRSLGKNDGEVSELMGAFNTRLGEKNTEDARTVVGFISTMTPEAQLIYQANAEQVDQRLEALYGNNPALPYVRKMLAQLKVGEQPSLSAEEQTALESILTGPEKTPTARPADAQADGALLLDNLNAIRFAGSFESAPMTLQTIQRMPEHVQGLYRSDPEFRRQLDESVKTNMGNDALVSSAMAMLEQIGNGQEPSLDILGKLRMNGRYEHNREQAIRDVMQAFKEDPTLRDRLANPQPGDKFPEEFRLAAMNAITGRLEGRFVSPEDAAAAQQIIETGKAPLETLTSFNNGFFNQNYDKVMRDILSATPAEQERLRTDKAYQDQVFGSIGTEQRKVLMFGLDQGGLKLEDTIRLKQLGWGGSDEIIAAIRNTPAAEMPDARRRASEKYGIDLEATALSKLGSEQRLEAERLFSRNRTEEEQGQLVTRQATDVASGFGSWLVGGNRDQLLSNLDQYTSLTAQMQLYRETATESEKAALDQRLKSGRDLLGSAVDNHLNSKEAVAEVVSNVAIGTIGIGSVIATGGASTPLLASVLAAGGFVKVGTNAVMLGQNYDWNDSGKDFTVGAITAGANMLGPGEVAAIFGVGKAAATDAVSQTMLAAARSTALKDALTTGADAQLKDTTQQLIADALAHGKPGIDPAAIRAAADQAISANLTGTARENAVRELSTLLETNLSTQWQQHTGKFLETIALNSTGAAAGNAIGAGADGIAHQRSVEQIGDSVLTAIFIGAPLGGGIAALSRPFTHMRISRAEASGVEPLVQPLPEPVVPEIFKGTKFAVDTPIPPPVLSNAEAAAIRLADPKAVETFANETRGALTDAARNFAATGDLNAAYVQAHTDLQAIISKMAIDETGVDVPVRIVERLDSQAAYSPQDGVLYLKQANVVAALTDGLNNPEKMTAVIKQAFHELTHHEQQVLQLRAIADQLNIGAQFTDADLIAVRKAFYKEMPVEDAIRLLQARGEQVTAKSVSDAIEKRSTNAEFDLIADVLRARQGVHLSPEQAARAQRLLDETGQESLDLEIVRLKHGNALKGGGGQQLLDALEKDPLFANTVLEKPDTVAFLYGNRIPPDVQQLMAIRQQRELTADEGRQFVSSYKADLERWTAAYQQANDLYHGAPSEVESHYTHDLIERYLQGNP